MALKQLKRADRQFPDNVDVLNALARTYKEMGKSDEASNEVERALELEPDSPACLITRAIVRSDADDYEGAESDLRKALETHPGIAEGWGMLGHTLLWKGRIDEAVECFERAAVINPGALSSLVEAREIPDDPAVIGGHLLSAILFPDAGADEPRRIKKPDDLSLPLSHARVTWWQIPKGMAEFDLTLLDPKPDPGY